MSESDLSIRIPLTSDQVDKLNVLAESSGCTQEAEAFDLLSAALEDSTKPVNPLVGTSGCPDDTIAAVRTVLALLGTATNSELVWGGTPSGIRHVLVLVMDALDYEARLGRRWFGCKDAEEPSNREEALS